MLLGMIVLLHIVVPMILLVNVYIYMVCVYIYIYIVHICVTSGGGHGNPLQYSCLENPMDRAWRDTVHGVSQSQTGLKQLSTLDGHESE